MGDVSVIARRLKDGHVQHGWSGNGGYFRVVGLRLLKWYMEPDAVEYLFSLGQLSFLGAPNSEYGGFPFMETHNLTRTPHYLGSGENDMFSKIAFVDYGYFYDTDNKWYYIVPRTFCIKLPLEYVLYNLDEKGFEFDFIREIEKKIMTYILNEYINEDTEFLDFFNECGYKREEILMKIDSQEFVLYEVMKGCSKIREYFDDWIVIETNEECTQMTKIKIKKKTGEHIETLEW